MFITMVILRTQNQAGPTKEKPIDAPNAGIIKSSFKAGRLCTEGNEAIFRLLSHFNFTELC